MLTRLRLPAILASIERGEKVIVYTHLVQGIAKELSDAIKAAVHAVGTLTGETDDTDLKAFLGRWIGSPGRFPESRPFPLKISRFPRATAVSPERRPFPRKVGHLPRTMAVSREPWPFFANDRRFPGATAVFREPRPFFPNDVPFP